MTQKYLVAVLLLLLNSSILFAQTPATIKGQITDPANKAVKAATVMLIKTADKKLVKTGISDGNGIYELESIAPGAYIITISSTGYQKANSDSFIVKSGEIFTVPTFSLKTESKSLSAVTVTGSYQKPMIEVKADKTVFNVESSINATGSNAFELLQKSPGVITDKDDNISLKGKNGVRIYIDGRQTQFSSADLAAYLKSINSADIEAIEMISNPSAKYDASGNAGIINIRLKRNKKAGFNGNISSGVNFGITPKINEALTLNYRNKNVSLFGTYSCGWGDQQNDFFLYRVQNDSIYDQKNKYKSWGWNHNVKAGADFSLNKRSTIGFIATGNFNNISSHTNSTTPISSSITHNTSEILYASNDIPSNKKNTNLNLNYRYADTTGHEINFDADYGLYTSRRKSYQPNSYYQPDGTTLISEKIYSNNTPTDIDIYTAKLDYETPLKKGKLGLGAKYSYVKTYNKFDFYNVVSDVSVIDINRSNKFDYTENVNAAYANYNRPLNKKWAIQAGLRVENTNSDGKLVRLDGQSQADDRVKRSYTDFFPSAAITYTLNPKNVFNLTYSRRIDRPNYQDLNPFENKLDELTYQKGNAFLRPQYTNSIELIHTFMYRFNTTLGYSHISDFKAQIIDTTEKSHSYITQKNLASQDIANINFSIPFQIKKWWTIYANINIYHSIYKANFGDGKVVNLEVTSGSFYAQQSFTLGKGYSAELSGFYNAPSVWAGTFKSKEMGGVDAGLQKKLLKDKANLKLSVTDIFHTMQWGGTSNYGGAYIKAHGGWESQQFRINFTYRFGNSQLKQARQRKTSSEDENKRTQNSGGFGGG